MSDPVTNVQIEDVLSSIRRLVSEESRLETRAKPEQAPRVNDRLVLTPALRVADDPVPEAKSAEPETAPVDAAAEPLALSDPIEVVDEDASDQSNEAPWQDPTATLFEAAQSPDVDDGDPEDEAETVNAEEAPAVGAGQEEGKVEIEDPDVVYDDAEEGEEPDGYVEQPASEEIEPEIVETAEMDPVDPEVEETDDIVWPELQSTVEPRAAEADASQEREAEMSHSERAESLSAKIEALEAAIGKTKDQWEPDGEIGDDYAGTVHVAPMAWRDHEAETKAQAGGDESGLGDLDEAVLDEESLRELVSDIVRQELQGALGERITRNVRKLVRREIHRALAAQELD